MRLFVRLVLVLALTWTRASANSGPGHESGSECHRLKHTMSLKDKTPILGQFHYIQGFSDSPFYKSFLKMTSSFWYNITETSSGFYMQQFVKWNGTCVVLASNATIKGHTAVVHLHNMTSWVQVFNVSQNSVLVRARTKAQNIHNFLHHLRIDPTEHKPDLDSVSLYLASRRTDVSDRDLQLFRDHAQCTGFTGEPDYSYQNQEFCSEPESVSLDQRFFHKN
ncbi:hypothetical protein NL108_012726 [Boleophthalmus pectinirostris]|uniref:uncharacterized protein LOC110156509 n=1 Tax=Boleophthalmus pectinirostris TaxID=150288 RepID=UPI0024303E17|nr:uncharacterized protein LOC110156509 [Boleophthalmus pectinirostris]KAJ0055209.1 hypothetical protein NL108_012726 [Boleophthalmus pectinirostris]